MGNGLRVKRIPKQEVATRIAEMLDVVGIMPLADRPAAQLSGGQQQRVALARALVNRPRVLLLDEPLSALDVKLREKMQLELKSIQERLGTTFVFVTHDQDEAMAMSDRIGVMNAGDLVQVGTPEEIYQQPADAFVAGFVGKVNEFTVTASGDGVFGSSAAELILNDARHDEVVSIRVRPERITMQSVTDTVSTPNSVVGLVVRSVFLGSHRRSYVQTALGEFEVMTPANAVFGRSFDAGDDVRLCWGSDGEAISSTA